MLTKEEMLEHPNYLTQTYRLEIFRLLAEYMEKNNLTKEDVAKKLNSSVKYVSQILNGNFDNSITKLVELCLMMGIVPLVEFMEPDDYWRAVEAQTAARQIEAEQKIK